MNRRVKYLSLILFVFLFFTCPISDVRAAADTITQDELDRFVEEQIDALELEALQKYIDSLGDFSSGNIKERLLAYMRGDGVDVQEFGETLLNILLSKLVSLAPSFACIIALALLSGLISMLGSPTNGITTSNTIFMIAYASALIPLLSVILECFTQTFKTMREIKTQMELIYPIMLTLMAASGGTLSASICKPAVTFFSNSIMSVVTSVILPLTLLIVVLSVASKLNRELKIDRFGAFFKSINKWLLGICVSVFGLFFTLQGFTSSSYDGIVKRVAKYAVGNGVPIIGGFLSGGFDLAVAGSVLIKNSIGGIGVFILVAVLFEPIVLLFATTLLLRFSCAVTQLFGDGRISDILGETADNLRYCTAGILFTAFLYFLTIAIMIASSEALF